MTRINILPVQLLSDGQLFSEYRESPRVINKIAAGKFYKQTPPTTFTYGQGHETFFSNKLLWLRNRHLAVRRELLRRRRTTDGSKYPIDVRAAYRKCKEVAPHLCNDWVPSEDELYYSLGRLFHRVMGYTRPDRKDGMVIDPTNLTTDPWVQDIIAHLGDQTRVHCLVYEAFRLHKEGGEYV